MHSFFFDLSRHRRFIAPMSLIAGALSTLLFAGCENRYASAICEPRCVCESCDAAAESSCIDHIDEIVRVTSGAGCKAQMETFFNCVVDTAECTDKHYDIAHTPKEGPVAPCDLGFNQLEQCLFPKTACQLSGAFELQCVK